MSEVLQNRSLRRNPWAPRTLFSSAMTGVVMLCAGIALVPLIAVLGYVLVNGLSRFDLSLLTQIQPAPRELGGGVGNAIQGTLYTVGIAVALAVPFGVMAAVFLSEFVRDTRAARWIGFATNVLSGVPSIVVGAFIYGVVVATTKHYSAMAGGLALAVLMLPVIVRTATESLELVPGEIRQAAVGLGATQFQTVSRVVLPAALPGILTGVMLSVARATGETAPVIFTVLGWHTWIGSVWDQTNTLSLLVYKFATSPFENQKALAWSASLLLVMFVFVLNVIARLVVRRRA
jgi:phosphate transport system permease protein